MVLCRTGGGSAAGFEARQQSRLAQNWFACIVAVRRLSSPVAAWKGFLCVVRQGCHREPMGPTWAAGLTVAVPVSLFITAPHAPVVPSKSAHYSVAVEAHKPLWWWMPAGRVHGVWWARVSSNTSFTKIPDSVRTSSLAILPFVPKPSSRSHHTTRPSNTRLSFVCFFPRFHKISAAFTCLIRA